jgi:hypothetical protein
MVVVTATRHLNARNDLAAIQQRASTTPTKQLAKTKPSGSS